MCEGYKGEKGKRGRRGPSGPQGESGLQGPQGIMGEIGLPGFPVSIIYHYLLHPPADVPIPSALFAPLNLQGRNNSHSPQQGERPGRTSRDLY